MLRQALAALLSLPGVLLVWLLAVVLVGVRGDFPLSDDWAYAHAVRALCEGRGLDLLPWTGASVLFQLLYGAAACKLGGFSHELLRLTTLAMSALGIVACHGLLREAGASRSIAAAGALATALSPLWFHLSFSFMTDLPFAALALLASWLYARALRLESHAGLLLAGGVAAAAFLTRQHGIFVAAAGTLAALLPSQLASKDEESLRLAPPWTSRLSYSAAASVLPLVALGAYVVWAGSDAAPLALRNKIEEAAGVSPLAVLNAAFRALVTLGFLLLPWAFASVDSETRDRSRLLTLRAVFVSLLSLVALFLWMREGATMFYLSNLLHAFHVGALTTRDVQVLGRPFEPEGGALLHFVLTALSLVSTALVLARFAAAFPRQRRGGSAVAPLASAAPYRVRAFTVFALLLSAAGSLLQAHYYFDRYLVALVPFAIAALVACSPPLRAGPAFAISLALLSLWSVAGTHDSMAWNRARWELLASLEGQGVSARQIDGGFEYNAARLAAELGSSPTDAEVRVGQPESRKSWWWVVDDEWIVAFGALDGYEAVETKSFSRWLPPGEDRVLLLRRR